MRNKFTWKPGMRRLALRGFRKYCFLGALHPAAWGEVPEGFFKRPVHGIVLELVRVGPGTSPPPPHLFFKLPVDSGLQAGWCNPGTPGAASASPVSPWMPSFLHLGVSMQGLSWVGLKPILTSTALRVCCLLVALSLGSGCGHTP